MLESGARIIVLECLQQVIATAFSVKVRADLEDVKKKVGRVYWPFQSVEKRCCRQPLTHSKAAHQHTLHNIASLQV